MPALSVLRVCRRGCLFWPALLGVFVATGGLRAAALSPPETVTFDLPADRAERALKRFSTQSGLQVVFAPELTDGVRTNAVTGRFAPMEAAERMLAGTPLRVVRDAETGVLSVVSTPRTAPAPVKKKSPGAGRCARRARRGAGAPHR